MLRRPVAPRRVGDGGRRTRGRAAEPPAAVSHAFPVQPRAESVQPRWGALDDPAHLWASEEPCMGRATRDARLDRW